jgi:hypothetical protein
MDEDFKELASWLRCMLVGSRVLDLRTVGGDSVRHHIRRQAARHLADKAIVSHGHDMQSLVEEMVLEGVSVPVASMSDDLLVKTLWEMTDRECIYAIAFALAGQS